MFLARPHERRAAAVAHSWRRLDRWFQHHLPELKLQPGAPDRDIASFEAWAELTLPEDVKESMLLHDGQQEKWPGREAFDYPGPLLAAPLSPLTSLASCLAGERQLCHERAQSDTDLYEDCDFDAGCTSFPVDAIQCRYLNPHWIPLSYWDGNSIGIDLDPGPNGGLGQVINFGRGQARFVLALSWAHLLEDMADELEAGHIEVVRDASGLVEYFGRPGLGDQAFHSFFQEWSEAKLPVAFQGARSVPREVVPPGKILTDARAESARQQVENFIRAMHAFEIRWLKIRPIHELGYHHVREDATGHAALAMPRAPGGGGCSASSKFKSASERLEFGKYRRQAVAERNAILEQYCTPRPRADADAFVQNYPPTYDPERDRSACVREVSEGVIVYMQPVEGATLRFHLLAKEGSWLIDLKDSTTDLVNFKKLSL